MRSSAVAHRQLDSIDLARLVRLPLLLWCLIAVLAVAVMDFRGDPARLATSLGDADDATRIVEVRELISGASWFDRTLPQIGAPQTLVSHWSRIVDAPIVALLHAGKLVLPLAQVEIVVRAAWPLMVLLALLLVMARWAERTQGRGAAIALVALTAYAHSAMLQFVPGRIDHHNMMILGAVGGLLMLARSFAAPGAGWLAGLLLGLGTAVGYEALPLTAGGLAFAALLAAWTGRGLDGMVRAATAFAGTLAVALAATALPHQWLVSHCDALSANLVVLAGAGAVGVAGMWRAGAVASAAHRVGLLAVPGAAGLALAATVEPRCLAGPFGEVDAALLPIWLAHVQETNSIVRYAAQIPAAAWQFVIFAGLGAAAALRLAWLRRDEESLVLMVALLASIGLACWQIKITPYATLLAAAPIALLIGRLEGGEIVSAPAKGLMAFLAVNQHSILGGILAVSSLLSLGPGGAGAAVSAADGGSADITRCQETAALMPLTGLAPGLVVSDIDLGAYIAALTPHRVLAAPYHRIAGSIIENEAIRRAPAEEARERLERLGADYVVICKGLPVADLPAASLAARLEAGAVPRFLEPVTLAGPQRLAVWRLVKRGP